MSKPHLNQASLIGMGSCQPHSTQSVQAAILVHSHSQAQLSIWFLCGWCTSSCCAYVWPCSIDGVLVLNPMSLVGSEQKGCSGFVLSHVTVTAARTNPRMACCALSFNPHVLLSVRCQSVHHVATSHCPGRGDCTLSRV